MIKEKTLLVGPDMPDDQVGLDRVSIKEVLRRLHQPDLRIMEQRHCPPEKIAMRDKIGVENRDEFRRIGIFAQDRERMVDVAGFGIDVVRAAEIKGALILTQRAKPRALPIIADPDAHPREINAKSADNAARQNAFVLIVGRDQYINARWSRQTREPAAALARLAAAVPCPRQVHKPNGPAEAGQCL